MSNPMSQYLSTIQRALEAGNATEHTHRPALKTLLEALAPGVTATNEPQHIACGAPDSVVTRAGLTVGYVEGKEVGKALDVAERSPEVKRYRESLDNLLLADYLEFRWYVNETRVQSASLAQPDVAGRVKASRRGLEAARELLVTFLEGKPEPVQTPGEVNHGSEQKRHWLYHLLPAGGGTKELD